MPASTAFPAGFLWGAATSAYQIEGSPLADGAGPSNWHVFSHTPGRTRNGDTGDVACDHYRRHAEDVELIRGLGLQAYRFSIAWSRIFPEGRGRVNPKGMDFYARLVDRLLAGGIQPLVTLHHWDLPARLDERGGWLDPDIVPRFAEYAEAVFGGLGDRVPMWATINEPWVIMDAGYVHGVHPPAHQNVAEAPLVTHHLLRAHGAAVQVYRRGWKQRICLFVNLEPKYPASDSAADRAAAARADTYMNEHYLDPVLRGRYPEGLPALFGGAWPEFPAGDLELARQPLDFIGVNYYTRSVVRHDPEAPPFRVRAVPQTGSPHTATGWEVHPASLTRALCWVKERYGDLPLYVTENGAAFEEPATAPVGGLEDSARVRYYRDHLLAALEAIRLGVDLRGYFAWSLLDNFEWSQGYSKRFGLFHVDFASQRRTPKASARQYREVVRSNGASLGLPAPAAGVSGEPGGAG
jgi:beta-glucosidase